MKKLLELLGKQDDLYFRGQYNPEWLITPSIYRQLIRMLKGLSVDKLKNIDKPVLDAHLLQNMKYIFKKEEKFKELEKHVGARNIDLALWCHQQHYGKGTIYIDWSKCIFTALLFSLFKDLESIKYEFSERGTLKNIFENLVTSINNVALYTMDVSLFDRNLGSEAHPNHTAMTGLIKIDPKSGAGWERMKRQSGILVLARDDFTLEDNKFFTRKYKKYELPASEVVNFILELGIVCKLDCIARDFCDNETTLGVQSEIDEFIKNLFSAIKSGKTQSEWPDKIPKSKAKGKFDPNKLITMGNF